MTAVPNTLPLPVLDEAAASLRSNGMFRAALTADDLTQMVGTVLSRLLAEYRQVTAEVLALEVHVGDSQGRASGAVRLTSPVSATLSPTVLLGNDPDPARIQLLNFTLKTDAGVLAKTVLGAFNLEGRARQALSNPNSALAEVLIPELQARGAELQSLGLHFVEHVLVAQLAGRAI